MRHAPRLRPGLLLVASLSLACADESGDESDSGESSGDGDGDGDGGGDGDGDGDGGGDGDGDGDGAGDGDGDGDGSGDGDGDGDGASEVCERWNADRADLAEGQWTGSLGSCDAGDMAGDWRARALTVVNLYRWLAALPPVTDDADRNAKAQECALMMHANDQLSHAPPADWTCYSADGAEAAGNSNIAGAPGIASIDLYMADPGNDTTMGHRRWILSNSLGPTGIGSTDAYACMWVLGGAGDAGQEWTAFPPPGDVPLAAMNASWAGVDETGWTIQSDLIDLAGAEVSITEGGEERPVAVQQLQGGYGSTYGISLKPQGWASQAGATYQVEVSGIAQPIVYAVHFVAC